MILLVILIAYALVGLACVRPVAGHLAYTWAYADRGRYRALYRDEVEIKPDGEQWFGGTLCGLACGLVWPLALLWLATGRFAPAVGAEKRAQLDARERRIKAAERELGIGR